MCLAYTKAGRKNIIIKSNKKKPLHKLSHNSIVRRGKDLEYLKQTPHTKFRCRLYHIPLY